MSTKEIALTEATTELTLAADQRRFNEMQLAALNHMGVADAPQADLDVFFHACRRTGLDPFMRQIHMIGRKENKQQPDGSWTSGIKYTIQTGIDGYRVLARRAASMAGAEIEQPADEWLHESGDWRPAWSKSWGHPIAARSTVIRDGKTFVGIANYDEYVQTKKDGTPMSMWAQRGAGQLAKCFSSDTEILTEHGFVPFPQWRGERIVQVTDTGLQLVSARPFRQEYDGPMVGVHGDMLDFSVTPNHDMVTTDGKVEAGVLLEKATTVAKWRIPLTAPTAEQGPEISDEALVLAGYFMADGTAKHRLIHIAVSRPRKVAALRDLGTHVVKERIKRDAGRTSRPTASGRVVRTVHDKTTFTYNVDQLAGTGVNADKTVSVDTLMSLSSRQARLLLDAWVSFDGNVTPAGVHRVRTSRVEHVGIIELLAAHAGYSVNVPRKRASDISERVSFEVTVSEPSPAPVLKKWRHRPGLAEEQNADGFVWCVTVPSGQIIVRRNGFAMVCGNCAEALAWRKAFPTDLAGIYVDEEMHAADGSHAPAAPTPAGGAQVTAEDFTGEQTADDVVEGEVLDEDTGEFTVDMAGPELVDQIFKLFPAAGITDSPRTAKGKQVRLDYMSRIVGREVTATAELTRADAEHVLAALREDAEAMAAEADLASQAGGQS